MRQSLVFLNVPTMQRPEAYISHSEELFDDSGKLTKKGSHEFLDAFMGAFASWVDTHLRHQ